MTPLRETAVTALFGCTHPVISAGMGGPARSELVAAVTRAGGFGFLGMVREPPELIAAEVGRLRSEGIERFGVNIIPFATGPGLLARQVDTIIALRVPVVALFWDIDAVVMARLREAGITIVYQVGSAGEARAAVASGAQAIIAQGCEAGGHVRGLVPLRHLLPDVARAVDVPVLAAGGISTGSDLVVARALGAGGVVLGTALLASAESFAHDHHKQRLVGAQAGDTLLTETFHINWPEGARVRVLSSAVTDGRRGDPRSAAREVIGSEDGRPIQLFGTDSPLRSMTGDFESMALYAGTGVGGVRAIRSAAAVIGDIVEEAGTILARIERDAASAPVESASPVCYAAKMSPEYAGQVDGAALKAELAGVLDALGGLLVNAARQSDVSEPPFAAGDLIWACWMLTLRQFAAAADLPPPLVAPRGPAMLRAALLARLRGLLPRLGDGAMQMCLARLADEIEAESVAAD